MRSHSSWTSCVLVLNARSWAARPPTASSCSQAHCLRLVLSQTALQKASWTNLTTGNFIFPSLSNTVRGETSHYEAGPDGCVISARWWDTMRGFMTRFTWESFHVLLAKNTRLLGNNFVRYEKASLILTNEFAPQICKYKQLLLILISRWYHQLKWLICLIFWKKKTMNVFGWPDFSRLWIKLSVATHKHPVDDSVQ